MLHGEAGVHRDRSCHNSPFSVAARHLRTAPSSAMPSLARRHTGLNGGAVLRPTMTSGRVALALFMAACSADEAVPSVRDEVVSSAVAQELWDSQDWFWERAFAACGYDSKSKDPPPFPVLRCATPLAWNFAPCEVQVLMTHAKAARVLLEERQNFHDWAIICCKDGGLPGLSDSEPPDPSKNHCTYDVALTCMKQINRQPTLRGDDHSDALAMAGLFQEDDVITAAVTECRTSMGYDAIGDGMLPRNCGYRAICIPTGPAGERASSNELMP